MRDTDTPIKLPAIWANGAGGSYITYPVPTPSQISITNGAASFYDGFPPNTFVPLAGGGAGPFGKDFNGVLKQMTAGVQWLQAGAPLFYDAAFSAAIGGYPRGTILSAANLFGICWLSVIDNNTTDPDTGGSGWFAIGGRYRLTGASAFNCNFGTGSDSTGDGSAGNPWKTLQFSWDYIASFLDAGDNAVGITQAGTDTGGLTTSNMVPGIDAVTLTINGIINSASESGISVAHRSTCRITGTGSILGAVFDVSAIQGGEIIIDGVELGACANAKIYSDQKSYVQIDGNYSSTGNTGEEWAVQNGGVIEVFTGGTITLIGTPNYVNAFATADSGGIIRCTLATFSGPAIGKRYLTSTGGGIVTNGGGPNFLPGNAPGSNDYSTFGWYV